MICFKRFKRYTIKASVNYWTRSTIFKTVNCFVRAKPYENSLKLIFSYNITILYFYTTVFQSKTSYILVTFSVTYRKVWNIFSTLNSYPNGYFRTYVFLCESNSTDYLLDFNMRVVLFKDFRFFFSRKIAVYFTRSRVKITIGCFALGIVRVSRKTQRRNRQGYGNNAISEHYSSSSFSFAYPPEFSCFCRVLVTLRAPLGIRYFSKTFSSSSSSSPSHHHSAVYIPTVMRYLSVEQCSQTTGSDRSSSLSLSLSPLFLPLVSLPFPHSSSHHPVVFLPWNQSNKGIRSSGEPIRWVVYTYPIRTQRRPHTYYISSAIACVVYSPSRAIFSLKRLLPW